MDIVRFKGGLGNQMFQYALLEALRSRGRNAGGNLGFYKRNPELRQYELDKVFKNIDLNEVSDEIFEEIDNRWKLIKQDDVWLKQFKSDLEHRFFYVEEKSYIYDERVFETKECAYVGYWQTEKYFSNIRSRLQHCFQFDVLDEQLQSLGNKYVKEYVSVHVRRGDYLFEPRYQTYNFDYYTRAMKLAEERLGKIRFVIFSDDMEWARENFQGEDVEFFDMSAFDAYQNWYDMYLMTRCVGNIISNSSFSWWGAWLSGNELVIAPDTWIKGEDTPDIWCPDWIKI